MEEPLKPRLIGRKLRDLRSDVHVEPEKLDARQLERGHRHRQSFIEGDSELHPLLPRPRVRVRSIDEHLRIDAERHRRNDTQPFCDAVEYVELLF